jgi:hypothetical protein
MTKPSLTGTMAGLSWERGAREGRKRQTDDATQRSFQDCPTVHGR